MLDGEGAYIGLKDKYVLTAVRTFLGKRGMSIDPVSVINCLLGRVQAMEFMTGLSRVYCMYG